MGKINLKLCYLFQREKPLNGKENGMSKKNFSDMSKEKRQKIVWEMSDEDIDFSDIPEVNEDFFKTAKRIEHPRKSKTDKVKINH